MFSAQPLLIHCSDTRDRLFTEQPTVDVMAQPDYWALHSAVTWDAPDLKLTIPAGFKTDFASIPSLLKGILDVDGRSRPAALLHDALYTWQVLTRSQSDQQLRQALIAYGEPSSAARVYWLGVRMGGFEAWALHATRGINADTFESPAAFQAYRAAGSPFLSFTNLT